MLKRIALALALLPAVALAQPQAEPAKAPAPPDTARYRQAVTRHAEVLRQAEATYLRAGIEADKRLAAELQTALDEAMSAKRLEDANGLEAALRAAKADLEARQARLIDVTAKRATVRVSASKGWQTVREVAKGEKISLRAAGDWVYNNTAPDVYRSGPAGREGTKDRGPLPTERTGALIGRIGEKVFVVGEGLSLTVPESGKLELRINDGDEGLDDNRGELEVQIARGQ